MKINSIFKTIDDLSIENPVNIYEEFKKIVGNKLIMLEREEILTAFIAKYGCEPDEIEQVEEPTEFGMKWYVRMKQ